MRNPQRGLTLLEVMAATLIAGVVAGGTLMAFAMSAKFTTQVAPNKAEAVSLAQQTLDKYRNRIAEDDAWLATQASAGCATWHDDLPPGAPAPSMQAFGATRQYCVEPDDCDGVGGPGDCYRVQVKVQWIPPQ